MILLPTTELILLGLHFPGEPNRECIVMRPTQSINLAQFGILAGFRMPNGQAMPLPDNFFWFGEMVVAPPIWIVVLTRAGQFNITTHNQTGEPIYSFFWGRKVTMFNNPNIVPILFQMSTVLVGGQPTTPLPQTNPAG
jgi:hypothetical protein